MPAYDLWSEPMLDDHSACGAPLAIGEVLRAVGQELADLGRLASDLQTVLSPAEAWAARNRAALDRLQSLDALTQRLEGMSEFLRILAPTVPAHWPCDAARAAESLTLSGLARRLGRPVGAACPPPDIAAGECELFGG